jgi:hypothetical protein
MPYSMENCAGDYFAYVMCENKDTALRLIELYKKNGYGSGYHDCGWSKVHDIPPALNPKLLTMSALEALAEESDMEDEALDCLLFEKGYAVEDQGDDEDEQ